MYEGFYRLKENPFRLSPDPAFIYMTPQHREALAGLVYSAYTRPGLTVLVGEVGTGKTTLLHALLGLLEKLRFVTAVCNNPTLTRDEFYDLLLAGLKVECPSSLKSRQLIALQDALLRYREEGRRAVLIVDEAQRLPAELLEEIRLLLNLETPREKLLDIIMAGQPELGELLGRPELRQLKQRISRICKLQALSPDDVGKYINHRLAQAGLPQQAIFTGETFHIIHQCTGGIPRLINSLCDGALQSGFAMQSREVTASIIIEAARDLELQSRSVKQTWDFPTNGHHVPEPAAHDGATLPAAENRPVVQTHTLRIPFDQYGSEHVSSGFFSRLWDRWRS